MAKKRATRKPRRQRGTPEEYADTGEGFVLVRAEVLEDEGNEDEVWRDNDTGRIMRHPDGRLMNEGDLEELVDEDSSVYDRYNETYEVRTMSEKEALDKMASLDWNRFGEDYVIAKVTHRAHLRAEVRAV